MGKYADRYFHVRPWQIVEEGFDPDYGEVAESVFSLGNEYTGLRGYFDEGYSGPRLQGSYLNGVYERRPLPKSGYKGMLPFTEFMVNTIDWVYTRIQCNGQSLDLATSTFRDFRRCLDLKTGVLSRSFLWQVDESTQVWIAFERFTSMDREQLVGQKITFRCICGTAQLHIRAGLDATCPHVSQNRSLLRCLTQTSEANTVTLMAETEITRQKIYAAARFCGITGTPAPEATGIAAMDFTLNLAEGQESTLERTAALLSARDPQEEASLPERIRQIQEDLSSATYSELKEASQRWWHQQWEVSDIIIDGDEENQQGIRFCIFQLHQTLHTAKYGAVFGAKGLTGEAYNGNTFWDSEVCCLPFYLYNNPEAAKSFLKFRYDTLPQAMERAAALDCKGAFYPIATISGRECCDLWQHASLQLQASTGVAYGLWNYVQQTGDTEFLYEYGAKMLVQISRMLASRGDFDPVTGQYGYYCVMGPDEFQMMVHHNAYTNLLGKKTLTFTLETLARMPQDQRDALDVTGEELDDWRNKAEKMYIPYDEETKLFEQHMGFFHLPHRDIASIPATEFPLYSHWSYERIYRNDMVKQPDVLMFFLLYGSDFTKEQLEANFDYYEPRCIHESSLSPAIHSILACRLGRLKKAEDYFAFATRMDLDNYNRNTREGLHTTSIAGAWMNIVCGFGGLCRNEAKLSLSPVIPAGWQGYCFHFQDHSSVVRVSVTQDTVTLTLTQGTQWQGYLYQHPVCLTQESQTFPLEV